MLTREEMMQLDVHDLTVLVDAAARKALAGARKLYEGEKGTEGQGVAYRLYLFVWEAQAKIARRVDYTRTQGLKPSGHLTYEAYAILSDNEWQSKVGPMKDYAEEIDNLLEQAGKTEWPATGNG